MERDQAFLGTGWGFPIEFHGPARQVRMSSEDADIRESLGILLRTAPGERVMQPGYGCDLAALVFENMTESTIARMKDLIERAVLFFEPRITLNGVDVDVREQERGLVGVLLDYTIRSTNTRSNMVYPFYFREGTAIRQAP